MTRTRADWVRFGIMLFGASLVLVNAVRRGLTHNWGECLFYSGVSALFVVVALMVISTSPRIHRWATWGRTRQR